MFDVRNFPFRSRQPSSATPSWACKGHNQIVNNFHSEESRDYTFTDHIALLVMVAFEVLAHNIKMRLRSPGPFGPASGGLSFGRVCHGLSHNIHVTLREGGSQGQTSGHGHAILQGTHALQKQPYLF